MTSSTRRTARPTSASRPAPAPSPSPAPRRRRRRRRSRRVRRHRPRQTPAAAAAAAERVAPFLEPVTSIGIDAPRRGRHPRPTSSVYWLEGNIQSILPITGGFEAATDALGWDLTTLTYDPSDPQGPSAAMQQAVDGGADYIAISGPDHRHPRPGARRRQVGRHPGDRHVQHRRDRRRGERHLRQHRQPGVQPGVVPAARRPGHLRLRRRGQRAGRQRARLRRSSTSPPTRSTAAVRARAARLHRAVARPEHHRPHRRHRRLADRVGAAVRTPTSSTCT